MHAMFLRRWLAAAGMAVFAFSAVPGHADTIKVGGTGSALGTMRMVGEAFEKTHPGIAVQVPKSLGSSGGINAVARGAVDLALSSRALREKEKNTGLRASLYAITPLGLFTARGGTNVSLSVKEVAHIFAGQRTAWPDRKPILIAMRPKTETDIEILGSYSPELKAALDIAVGRSELPILFADQDTLDFLEDNPGSFGAMALAAAVSERRRITPIDLDGVAPTVENLANGTYRLSKAFYFVHAGTPKPSVQKLMAFVRSPAGADILRAAGNLPKSE